MLNKLKMFNTVDTKNKIEKVYNTYIHIFIYLKTIYIQTYIYIHKSML